MLKMIKSVVYQGDTLLGEVEIYPQNSNIDMTNKQIRISHFSQPSERCPPLAVLHTITSCGVCFKMESKSQSLDTPLFLLHFSCLRENKTAVMSLGEEELHLVPMHSRKNSGQYPCFWGFIVAVGLYNSCLVMLNLRCLGIVFDLDETLIVANTMRSFEDRIEALQRKINTEVDQQRVAGMMSEVKRYYEDKNILKQYVENDQVVENGKVIKVQPEIVPALSGNHQPIIRPLIRLPEKNIILTRINPLIRDTSVLVRLRPAWEDLRSYLTARGRKRFEVYVCTMAERDYALEMWRLLDPESNLINSKELLDRIVCVKSGLRKSLFNVFQEGQCHPKMSLVIDDRLKVWDDKDQPRVHVVPAFAPYYSPQAEANNAVPVLCVARNVACNVRGGFFKEFDEGLLQRISEVSYEDDIGEIPSPDVSNYLVSEDDASASNGNKDPICFDGMADAEVERRLKEAITCSSSVSSTATNLDSQLASTLQYPMPPSSSSNRPATQHGSIMSFPNKQIQQIPSLVKPFGQVAPSEASLHNSPAREEGEVPESELDPDTRRRLLILQHGQDTRDVPLTEPPPPPATFPVRPPPLPVSVSRVQLNRVVPKELPPLDSERLHMEKNRPNHHHPSLFNKLESSLPPERTLHEGQRLAKEALRRDERLRLNYSLSTYHSFPGEEISLARSFSKKDLDFESGRGVSNAETPVGVLQDIAKKCGTEVEFRPALVATVELLFSIEVIFAGERVGEGIGKTRREAQRYAAEDSLKNLANKYLSRVMPDASSVHGELSRFSYGNDNVFSSEMGPFTFQELPKEDFVSFSTASEPSRLLDSRLDASKKTVGSVSALKELCITEGLGLVFQQQDPLSSSSLRNDEVYVQAEIDGEVLGKGIGLTLDEAKMQAAEKALGSLKSTLGRYGQKRQGSPTRQFQGMSNKRSKPEYSRVLQRVPSSVRYPKNAPPVP